MIKLRGVRPGFGLSVLLNNTWLLAEHGLLACVKQEIKLLSKCSVEERAMRWAKRHWLAIVNSFVLLYGGLPWLAPLLTAFGHPKLGHLLFALYTPLCHQKPARAFFILGQQVAFCHREAAMYTFLFIGGLIFGPFRRLIQPLSLRKTGFLLFPMFLDGLTHLFADFFPTLGLRGGGDAIGTVNWELRMLTGLLFAIAVCWGIYPRLEHDFAD